jgi:hypothetical protein
MRILHGRDPTVAPPADPEARPPGTLARVNAVSSALGLRRILVLAAIVLVSVVTGVLHYAGGSDVAVFTLGVVALGGLAWVISFTT